MILNYRKDIDGLRAIAVLLVTMYHIGFNIPGGFIGVDIFFVISGFLIASLIQKQILKNKFSFKGFYLHRMRRILPALIAVIMTSFIIGWFILMPRDFSFFVKSIVYSLLGVSNIYFYSKGKDYFSADIDQVTLAHTWSLGVEEQFYVIMPIFLLFLFKFFNKTKWFNIILVSLLILSVGLSHYLALTNASFAYYLLPARFFELLIGVVLALNYTNLPTLKNKVLINSLAVLSLFLIFLPAFLLDKASVFPGLNALFVCLGSAFIIYLGKTENILSKALSIKPLVFIGLISYSLYLWHWVAASMLNVVNIELSLIFKFVLLFGLIVISYLSWKFIEQPFRHKFKFGFGLSFVILLLVPVILADTLKRQAKKTDGFYEYRFSDYMQGLIKTSQDDASQRPELCHSNISLSKGLSKENCTIGRDNIKVSALMFGDSHANSYAPFMNKILDNAGIKAHIMTEDAFVYFKNIANEKMGNSYVSNSLAVKIAEKTSQEIETGKYKYVIMAGNYNYYLRQGDFNYQMALFEENVKQIKASGGIPVILKDIYKIRKNQPYCPIYNKLLGLNKDCSKKLTAVLKSEKSLTKILDSLQLKYPELIIIDPKKVMCDAKKCATRIEDTILYRDETHLTYPGSAIIADKYLEILKNPF